MKTLLLVMSICAALIVGCDNKDDKKGKEIGQNDELIQQVNKVNSDLEKIRSRDINESDAQSLNKISIALQESRERIADLESRINSVRRRDMAERETKPAATLRSAGERVTPSEQMSEGVFERKLQDLAKELETGDSDKQLFAAKSVRGLQASYPDRDFSIVVIPLMRVVKNEDASGTLRIIAARALHSMDSERGNYAIKGVARESNNQSVRKVCSLLSAERARQDERLEEELDREEALTKR